MIKGQAIGVYKQIIDKEADDTVDHTFYGAYIKPKQIVELTHLSVMNIDESDKKLSIGIQQGSKGIHWIKKEEASNRHACWLNGHIILTENERPVGRVENPDGGNDLKFTAMGLIYAEE